MIHAPDQVAQNHRLLGWGTLRGADAMVPTLEALIALAPDTRLRVDHLRTCERGFVWTALWHGTRDGGAFETPWVVVVRLDELGRQQRMDVWDIEESEAAWARFEELRAEPLRVPPNAATRTNDQAARALAAGDRATLRAMASPDFRFEDRGRRALVSGNAEVWLDSALFLGSEHRARLEPELLATLGDRIAVYRDAWTGSTEGGGFELGGIRVFEVNSEGKLRALILFDSDDRSAAFAEAISRFAQGEADGCMGVEVLTAFLRALNGRDWRALRDIYTSDFVLADRRALGLGVLGREAWVASLQATVELSVGLAFEVSRVLAWNENGVVTTLRRFGSIPDGGGPFENFPIGVALNRGDRIARYELFDDTDAVRAVARFEELCAALET